MNRVFAVVAAILVSAAPAFAQGDQPDLGCGDPQTTGSLPDPAQGVRAMDAAKLEVTPPEDSWQEQAQVNAERRRRARAEGCPTD